jgi:DNA-nicking Smr family endonuclease
MLDWNDRPPAAVYDLHGQTVSEAALNAERFLRAQAKARPGAVVRLITGRGRGGGGAPIRTRVRAVLRGMRDEGAASRSGVVRDFVLEESEGSYLVRLGG